MLRQRIQCIRPPNVGRSYFPGACEVLRGVPRDQDVGANHTRSSRRQPRTTDDLKPMHLVPYQAFRIFHEICYFTWETGRAPDIAYMVDQSHNLKNKIEETIQTSNNAQELFVKAARCWPWTHDSTCATHATRRLSNARLNEGPVYLLSRILWASSAARAVPLPPSRVWKGLRHLPPCSVGCRWIGERIS
jgi:hypothetical protein